MRYLYDYVADILATEPAFYSVTTETGMKRLPDELVPYAGPLSVIFEQARALAQLTGSAPPPEPTP